MRKKLFAALAVAVVAVVTGYNVYSSQKSTTLSDLALANVEALANSGETDDRGTLYGNSAGTQFCCCPGTNYCGAARCSGCPTL